MRGRFRSPFLHVSETCLDGIPDKKVKATAEIPGNRLGLFLGCPGLGHPACPVRSLRQPGTRLFTPLSPRPLRSNGRPASCKSDSTRRVKSGQQIASVCGVEVLD